jgi:hypothetical protein
MVRFPFFVNLVTCVIHNMFIRLYIIDDPLNFEGNVFGFVVGEESKTHKLDRLFWNKAASVPIFVAHVKIVVKSASCRREPIPFDTLNSFTGSCDNCGDHALVLDEQFLERLVQSSVIKVLAIIHKISTQLVGFQNVRNLLNFVVDVHFENRKILATGVRIVILRNDSFHLNLNPFCQIILSSLQVFGLPLCRILFHKSKSIFLRKLIKRFDLDIVLKRFTVDFRILFKPLRLFRIREAFWLRNIQS